MTTGIIEQPTGYLFLDVDGVISPIRSLALYTDPDWHRVVINGYRVWVGDSLSQWLNDLLHGGIQIVWATTWIDNDEMLTELSGQWRLPLDLPRISHVQWEPDMNNCGKGRGVACYLDANAIDPTTAPVAWVDDNLGPTDLSFALDAGIRAFPVPPEYGLSSAEWRERVEAWLNPARCATAATTPS